MILGERKVTRIPRFESMGELSGSEPYIWRGDEGIWWLYLPRCGVANLANHTVTENHDGTITITPSILTEGHDQGQATEVHGFVTDSVWRDA